MVKQLLTGRSSTLYTGKLASGCSCQVLSVQDSQGLLQGLDLFFSAGNPVIVADSRVYAGGLQLVEVGKCGIEFLLRALEILTLRGQCLCLILLLCRLVLDVLRLRRLVNLRVGHEGIVVLLCCRLSRLRIGLPASLSSCARCPA